MIISEETIKKQLKHIKDLIIWFNKQPSALARLEIKGAVDMLAIMLDAPADIHFSQNDPNFLTFIRFYKGADPLYTVSAVASDIEIPADSSLGRMLNA